MVLLWRRDSHFAFSRYTRPTSEIKANMPCGVCALQGTTRWQARRSWRRPQSRAPAPRRQGLPFPGLQRCVWLQRLQCQEPHQVI